MSELRNRSLAPPPPRHPAIRSPSPNPRLGILNAPPPPVHPSHPPLPPRPPPNPRSDARLESFGPETTPSQATTSLDTPHTPHIQRLPQPVPPNLPSNARPFSENVSVPTSSIDVTSVELPVPPPQQPSPSPELHPPVSPPSSFNPATNSSTTRPPVHHAREARSFTLDSAYEAALSEKELRDLYDDEEIDRFLRLFSVFVNEVKLNDGGQSAADVEFTAATDGIVMEGDDNDDKDHVSMTDAGKSLGLPHDGSKPQTISEHIAQTFIAPYLPKATKTIPPFTVLRFRLAMQRLYLALEPGYQFVVDDLVSLAIWEDKSRSLRFCLGYWVLWVHNLLFPTFIFYLLYVLLYRRMHPYPSLAQLREHRGHIDEASEFGEELQGRLTVTSPFGVLDAWKTLRVYNKNKTRKAKEKMKQFDDTASVMSAEAAATDGDTTAAERSGDKAPEQDIKALGLEALCELIDGLERLKNLFLWRKPSASYTFSIILGVIGFLTLVLPAQWLAKAVYFVLGFAFWHAPPILVALPGGDHRRLLALLHHVPTDADYAMELIAQRVTKGQEIKPLNRKGKTAKKSDVMDVPSHGPNEGDKPDGFLKQSVSVLKAVADTGYQAIGGQQFIHNKFAPAVVRDAGPQDNSRSYPAQRGKTPGVITVSTEKFYFTPLLSGPKLEIALGDIVGIKRATLKGISIEVKDAGQESGERKEKFMLVHERDELFGRLVGTGGKKWMRS